MRYYVISDVHSFYSETMQALSEKGFFEDKSPHKLIVCGDLFDRGSESVKMQNFICELLKNDDVILVRGNHEDLILDLIRDAKQLFGHGIEYTHHCSNGTVKTVTDLTGTDIFTDDYRDIINKLCATPYITEIIPKMLNYYETKKYVFVHGWIPCNNRHGWSANYYAPIEDWREVGESSWKESRWINGMLAYSYGVVEKDKTIVCGHWHSSWGHCRLEGKCSEFGKDSDFSPFYAEGIIAIDGCTAYSGRVNCIVLEDENI